MSNKVFNTRIQNKLGTEADWAQAVNFTPLLGELVIYDIDENHSMQRIKIGDGVSNVNALPFVNTPDWNAAEGEPGYILNRPFYTEYSGVTEMPLTGEWSEVDPDMWQYLITAPIGLEVGKTYVVNWNGVDYTVVAKVIDDPSGAGVPYVGIGNEALIGGTDTGEPFGIMETTAEYAWQFGGIYGMAASSDMSGNIPFTIYTNDEVVHKLPVKYLPEGVPYSEGEYKEILPEYQWEIVGVDEDTFVVPGTTPLDIVENEFYTVNWNGIEYNCQAIGLEEDGIKALVLGNLGIITGIASEEPFVIAINPKELIADSGYVLAGMPINGSTSGTLSIYKSEIIHKLDNKYLNLDWIPEDIKVSLIPKASIECTYPQSNGSYGGMYALSLPVFEDKQEVLVIFDNQEYKCKVSKTPYITNCSRIYIGNKYLGNSNEESTGEPFCIYGDTLDGFALYTTTPGVHTIEICTTKPNKLPDKYLNLDWLLASSKEVIIEETKVVASEPFEFIGESGFKVEFEGTFDLGIGEKDIFVCYDGIEYEAKYASDMDGTYIFGKNSLLIDNEFVLANAGHGNSMLFTKTPGAHTISIYFRKISEKYLSDNLVTEDELVASDWEANSEEPGHILNRPFYTEDSEYVLEEIPINGEWDGDTRYDFISPLNLAIGETYIVNCDGVDYTVVGKAYKENNILTCVSLGGESEHPFFIFGESGYNGNDACAYGTKCSFTISRVVNTNILKPTTINFNESIGMIYEKSLPLNIGDTYIVYWNGIGYPCVAQDLDGAVGLGNGEYDGFQGNEEPFFIISEPDLEDVWIITYDDRVQEQIRLFIDKKEPKHKVHKLDNKYLNLDWIPSDIEVNKILAYPYYYYNYQGIEGFKYHLDYKHQPFVVICDGISYQTQLVTTKINDELITYCGNRAILDGEKDTGEPFVGWLENAGLILRFTDIFTHQISIITIKNKMPLNYLPESVFEIIDSASIIVQDDEPYNVPDGSLWLDTDAIAATKPELTLQTILDYVIANLPKAEEASI